MERSVSSQMGSICSSTSGSLSGIERQFASQMSSVNSTVSDGFGNMATDADRELQKIVRAIETNMRSAIAALRTTTTQMTNIMQPLRTSFQNIGTSIMQGLNQGLIQGQSQVLATARNIANQVRNTMQSALQINSPSRVMRDKVGGPITQGIGVGIESNASEALAPANKLSEALSRAFDVRSKVDFKISELRATRTPYVGNATANEGYEINNNFNISSLVIREEADIQKLAQQLHKQQERHQRAQGRWSLA